MCNATHMNCIGSVNRWCRYWNVTRIQLEIAKQRAGSRPADIARELGLAEAAVTHFERHDGHLWRLHPFP
jgi:hypothetical protein